MYMYILYMYSAVVLDPRYHHLLFRNAFFFEKKSGFAGRECSVKWEGAVASVGGG